MSKFSPKKIIYTDINQGDRYELRDDVSPEAINAPIEASAYAQDLAEQSIAIAQNALEKVDSATSGSFTIPLLLAYPVGSVYLSTNSTSPALLFGGNWEQLENGRVLVSAGGNYQAGGIGGSETHTITPEEILDHKHNIGTYGNTGMTYISQYMTNMGTDDTYNYATLIEGVATRVGLTSGDQVIINGKGFPLSALPSSAQNASFSLMQPYLVVYMWQRLPD